MGKRGPKKPDYEYYRPYYPLPLKEEFDKRAKEWKEENK